MLKWGGLALAVCGVLALYADATVFKVVIKDPPVITLDQIEPTMNFAVVKLENCLVTGVTYDELDVTLGIWLSQGGQTIFVRVYDEETKRLIATGNIPGTGDYASIIGQLRVRPDFRMMILQVAGGLRWSRPEAQSMSIPQLLDNAENLLYKRVSVEGKFISTRSIGWASTSTIQDNQTGENVVVLVPYVPWMKKFEELGIPENQKLRVSGAVSLYYDQVQLLPANLDEDIRVIS